jgi:aspartate ammonia-lyase
MSQPATRLEHDLLGDRAVLAEAYYGVQTARALDNFRISGVELRLYPDIIRGFALVKLAAARANVECGVFSREVLSGIEKACEEQGEPGDSGSGQHGLLPCDRQRPHGVARRRGRAASAERLRAGHRRLQRATELAAEAMRTGRGILEPVREQKVLSEDRIAAVLDPVVMTGQPSRR